MEHVFDLIAVLRRVRHSRMLLAGIQAESGLDPRLKHSGVTVLRVASLRPSRNFQRSDGGMYCANKLSPKFSPKNFALPFLGDVV
jgi:hypothetical protein